MHIMMKSSHYSALIFYVKFYILCFSEMCPITKRGGGISIFIKDSIRAKHLYRHSLLHEDHIETLFIEINTGERTTCNILKRFANPHQLNAMFL